MIKVNLLELAIENVAHAYHQPEVKAGFKLQPEDFCVDEELGFELSGEGEHLFLHMRKKGLNTEQLAQQLAQDFGLSKKSVSYAGLKDKQAVTTQWFCVHLPGKQVDDLSMLNQDNYQLISAKRHHKKLKIGYLKGNHFTILLRNVMGSHAAIDEKLHLIKLNGVPNYFGAQRFGHQGQNLVKAEQVLLHNKRVKNKFLRGVYYSAARSLLFNRMLSKRVEENNWHTGLAGDVMQLAGSKSYFVANELDESIQSRIAEFDISPAGPLWGEGDIPLESESLVLQQQVLSPWQSWCQALVASRLKLAFRPYRLQVEYLTWQWQGDDLQLSFYLPAGSYATAVLRELLRGAGY